MAKQKQQLGDKLEELERKYGLGKSIIEDNVVVDTGSIQLNRAMQIGGTPLGKMIEIFGQESSGKSTITLHQMAEYQKAFPERKVVLMDFEHSFDKKYARKIGVDVDALLVYQPDYLEQGYDMLRALIESDLISCAVIDSQTAAAPKIVLDGEMEDATIGLQARLNSKFCLKVKGLLAIHKTTLFIISQTRASIGGYGDGSVTTGGNAIKFYSDVRWKLWKTAKKDNEINVTTIDIIKSKVGKPFGQAKINIKWGVGFDAFSEVIDYACALGFVKKGGAGWYSIEEMKAQGMDNFKQLFDDNPGLFEELKEKVLKALDGIPVEEMEEIADENM